MFRWFRRAGAAPTEEQLLLSQALIGYPQYAPPDWDMVPSDDDEGRKRWAESSKKYAQFFHDSRAARLDALRGFLARFEIVAGLDDAGVMAVSSWLPRYADLLVGGFDQNVVDAYKGLKVPWAGPLNGLNPIFDLGVYYAECLWCRRTKLKWIVLRAPGSGVASHLISGLPGGKLFDPISWMRVHCSNVRALKNSVNKMNSIEPWELRAESFYRKVLSDAPPGRRSRTAHADPRQLRSGDE